MAAGKLDMQSIHSSTVQTQAIVEYLRAQVIHKFLWFIQYAKEKTASLHHLKVLEAPHGGAGTHKSMHPFTV